MAANTQRNSTNLNNSPTITIVDSIESRNKKATMGSCCFCVPEIVGVFAILSMYFFTGIFGAAASFLSLGYTGDVLTKAILGISGTLNTLTAISSALGVTAIRKEKFVLMRRLSIAFWVLTALVIILNIIILVFDFKSREANVEECVNYNNGFGVSPNDDVLRAECEHAVGASLIGETIRLVALGSISIYFAYVIFRFAKNMKKEVLPFTATTVPINGQSTPIYYVSAQPPTSNNWVPPPTYTVKALYVPDDFKPDSKNP